MLEKGKLSIRQLTILVMLVTIGDSILVIPLPLHITPDKMHGFPL